MGYFSVIMLFLFDKLSYGTIFGILIFYFNKYGFYSSRIESLSMTELVRSKNVFK